MELAKRIIHKEGLDREPLAAVCDAEQSHHDDEEQKAGSECHSGMNAEPEKVKEEKPAEFGGHVGAGLGSAVVKYGGALGENAFTFALNCIGIEGNEPNNNDNRGGEQETNTQGHDEDATPSIKASDPLHEHHDTSTASLRAGDLPLDLPMGSDSGSTVHDDDSHSDFNTPILGLSVDEPERDAQIDSESHENAEFLAKIARFELPKRTTAASAQL